MENIKEITKFLTLIEKYGSDINNMKSIINEQDDLSLSYYRKHIEAIESDINTLTGHIIFMEIESENSTDLFGCIKLIYTTKIINELISLRDNMVVNMQADKFAKDIKSYL